MSEQLVANQKHPENPKTAASFQSQKRFYDDINFPKGFRRSGDFTNKEAELLEAHGDAMKALANGTRLPATVEEQQFVDVIQGKRQPSGGLELIWNKYCRLAQGKPFYAVVGTVRTATVAPPEVELELDDDISDGDISDEVDSEESP